jgi:hypothetical protein
MPVRSNLKCLLALSIVVLAMPQAAMSGDCTDNKVLTLKESQGGFAGTTGTVWTVHADCSFTVSRFVNVTVSEPHKRGNLTPEQQAALAKLLSEKAVSTLPAAMGNAPQVNAHQITLQHDGKTSVLTLGPGTTDTAAVEPTDSTAPAKRLVDVFRGVKLITGTDN